MKFTFPLNPPYDLQYLHLHIYMMSFENYLSQGKVINQYSSFQWDDLRVGEKKRLCVY